MGWPVGIMVGDANDSVVGWLLLNSVSKSLSDDDNGNPFVVLKSFVGTSVGFSVSVLGE